MQSIKSGYYLSASLLLAAAIFILGYMGMSHFETACAVCAVLFWLMCLQLSFTLKKSEAVQRKQCRPIGYFLLIPAIGMIGIGVFYLFELLTIPADRSYIFLGLPGVLSLCLILQMRAVRKNNTPAGKFYRLVLAAALSSPMSLIVTLSLYSSGSEDAAMLGAMSTIIFGSLAFLIAANMILVSSCGYQNTAQSVRTVNGLIKRHRLVFTHASLFKDAFLVAGKGAISIISLSFFMFVNALYSTGMGITRYIVIKMHSENKEKQVKYYRLVGIIISASSICYVLYSVRLFFGGKTGVYDMNVALVIAFYTFVEFGINIKEAVKLRKSKELNAKALRAISFSSTLICFVLTQTAIMSFAAEGDHRFANALSGVVFGGLAATVGLYVLMDSYRHRKAIET